MLDPGSLVGSYRVMRLLAEGGMGAVYEGLNEAIERRVAIKVLHRDTAREPEIVARFFNEAWVANRIDHPGLVQVHDHGKLPDGTAYLVMELLKGETLEQRLERDALRGKVASLEQELAIQRDHLIDKQREMELLLPWLPAEDAAQTSRVSCSEVLQRIEPLNDIIKLVSSPSGTMSDQDKLRWFLCDAESVVTGLRTLCGEQ